MKNENPAPKHYDGFTDEDGNDRDFWPGDKVTNFLNETWIMLDTGEWELLAVNGKSVTA